MEIGNSQTRRFTAKDIAPDDLQRILTVYGQDLEDIYSLGPGQQWILEAGQKNNSSFVMRMMFEAELPVEPAAFREKVNEVCKKQESLRFAYAYRGMHTPYIVVLKNRTADIHFEDLTSLSADLQEKLLSVAGEEDGNRGFDLEKDPLLRITVYKLGEKRHAFLLSMHHINADGASVGLLMKDIFVDYALNIDTSILPASFSYKNYSQYLENVDKRDELTAWRDYLQGTGACDPLPGEKEEASGCRNHSETVLFSTELEEALTEAARRCETTRFNILAAAWAVMLNRINGTEDVVFGTMTSGRVPGPGGNLQLAGGFALPMPMRIRPEKDRQVSDLFREATLGTMMGMKNTHCSLDEISAVLRYEEPVFNHILNYQNFMSGSETMDLGIPGFRVLDVNMSGDMSCDLVVCVTCTPGGNGVVFGYNAEVWARDTIRLYGDCYLETLMEVAQYPDKKIGEFTAFGTEKFEYTKNADLIADLKKAVLLKKLPILAEMSEDDLIRMASDVRVETYRQNERIIERGNRLQSIPVILKGRATLWLENRTGWSVPIRLIAENRALTMDALMDGKATNYTALARTPECQILQIPLETFIRMITDYPRIALQVIRALAELNEKLERMWGAQ